MRKIVTLAIVVAGSFGLLFAKPMESLSRYNVVLVHGAAPEADGFESSCKKTINDANTTMENYASRPDANSWNLGDATGMLGSYDRTFQSDSSDDWNVNTGKKLTYWLDSAVFEDTVTYGSEYIYIQRSFANPAASPAHNAHEIGDRTWKGNNNCSVRRALFEEAQEVRAHGQDSLKNKRNSKNASYRSIPSRNILIAHSMGGVASHEYVTDTDVYNGDVDKVITLDSPHRGTYSLDGLLDMKHYIASTSVEVLAQMSLVYGTALVLGYGGFAVNQTALIAITYGFVGLDALNAFVDAVVDLALQYDYTEDDPLASYIVPGSADLKKMNERPWNERTPMFRLLYGVGGLTFGSNEEYLQDFGSLVVPDGLFAMVKNIIAQASHTEFDGGAYANNIIAGGTLGLAGGLGLTDHGSILIPHWSGAGEEVTVFESENADIVRTPFAANLHTDQSNEGMNVMGLVAAGSAALIGCEALNVFSPAAVKAAKTAIGISTGVALASWILPPTIEAIKDMKENHENAKARRMLDTLYSAEFSYNKVMGGDVSGKTLLMEDFLYEKPFVNLGLFVSADSLRAVDANCFYEADSSKKERLCEIGLYGANGEMVSKTGRRNYKEFQKSPIAFKSGSDWEKIGMKIDRWERVDGLKPDGSENPGGVPIRHVERYNVLAITVDNWIEKYSFVVDDLMPHRLRQIRMNFNFNEEIAWECDITKPENASDACEVFKRSGGGNWKLADSIGNKGYVPHPVKKNGQFDFVPGDYGYNNLLAIQKDNQNTVTVSTVNKIGLSNTQRFYYLYKATDNKLNEVWPRRDIVLNKITGFKAFASALGYQGFRVSSAWDSFLRLSGDSLGSVYSKSEMDMDLDTYYDLSRIGTPGVAADGLVYDSTSAYFTSRQSDSIPAEGSYVWQFFANIVNTNDSAVDTNSYEVPFKVDRTAPVFAVTPEYDFMNPSKTAFVARYAWADTLHGPDIRAMRWTLEGGCTVPAGSAASAAVCTNSHEMRAFYDVGSSEFAVPWDSASRAFTKNHGDGLYRVKAFAVDAAVSDSATYMKMANLVDEIARDPSNVNASLWPTVADSLNATTEYATFVVDVTAPKLENVVAGADSGAYSSYASLARPARNSQYGYATYDSLLKISYKVTEPLIGRDSTAVTVLWNFVHLGDTSKVDRVGDSVWVKSTGSATAEWREASGMRLEDGDYEIRALASDAAKNDTLYRNLAKVRIDKTAPTIFGLTSDRLVYPDSVTFEMESV